MAEKKRLVVNSDICDARQFKAEKYAQYEEILINCDLFLVTPESQAEMAPLPITINHDETLVLEKDQEIDLRVANGSEVISAGDIPAGDAPQVLIVNGRLEIEEGCEAVLERYAKIIVNGSASLPSNLNRYLTKFTINGSVDTYPAGCIRLKSSFVLDKYFPLRAREDGRYYVRKQLILSDKEADLAKLMDKRAHFVTPRMVVPEEMVESALGLVDETCDLKVVPAGFDLVADDAVMDEGFVEAHSGRIYVLGDLEVTPEGMDGKLPEKLIVEGTVELPKALKDRFLALDAQYKDLRVIHGKRAKGLGVAKLDRAALSAAPDGISFVGCGMVRIDPEVTPEEIMENTSFTGVGSILCSDEQAAAVSAVAEGCGSIGPMAPEAEGEEEAKDDGAAGNLLGDLTGEGGIGGILGGLGKAVKALATTRFINADRAVL